MEDRELLEMAAKAAGIPFDKVTGVFWRGFESAEWKPLTDDGDALRLAMQLGLSLVFDCAPMTMQDLHGKPFRVRIWCVSGWVKEDFDDNSKTALVRRAIVSAAAEIGRSMP